MAATIWPVTRTKGRALSAPPSVQGKAAPLPVRRPERPPQTAPAVPAIPLPAPLPAAAPPLPKRRAIANPQPAPTPAPTPAAVKKAPTAIRDGAETRIAQLIGQTRQDGETLVNAVQVILRRIEAGETPRQEGEFMVLARRLDQNCASLYELLRLTKCY